MKLRYNIVIGLFAAATTGFVVMAADATLPESMKPSRLWSAALVVGTTAVSVTGAHVLGANRTSKVRDRQSERLEIATELALQNVVATVQQHGLGSPELLDAMKAGLPFVLSQSNLSPNLLLPHALPQRASQEPMGGSPALPMQSATVQRRTETAHVQPTLRTDLSKSGAPTEKLVSVQRDIEPALVGNDDQEIVSDLWLDDENELEALQNSRHIPEPSGPVFSQSGGPTNADIVLDV
jgi:hypothetical protein